MSNKCSNGCWTVNKTSRQYPWQVGRTSRSSEVLKNGTEFKKNKLRSIMFLPVAFYGGSHGSMSGSRAVPDLRRTSGSCVGGGTLCEGTGEFVLGRRHIQDLPFCTRYAVDGVGVSLLRFCLIRSRWSATFRDTWSRRLLELSLLQMSHKLVPVRSIFLKQDKVCSCVRV